MSGLSRGEAYKILREIGYIQQAEKRKKHQQNKIYIKSYKDEKVTKTTNEDIMYTFIYAIIVIALVFLLLGGL